jgi:DNA-3-methyladenine glycosylase II
VYPSNTVKHVITTPADFNFKHCLSYMSRSNEECAYTIEDETIYKLFEIEKELLIVSVEGGNGTLNIHFLNGNPTSKAYDSIIRYIREWFDLDRDLTPFYRMAENDRLLKEIVQRYKGLRLIGIPDLFESICWAIIGQQINLSFAYKLKRRFVETFGRSLFWNNKSFWLFPEPQVIANLTVEQLTALKFTTRKAEYLIEVAKHIVSGRITKNGLLALQDFSLAVKQLIQLRGIGNWTANYALMRCLKDPNAFPVEDVGLHNAIKRVLKLERKPTIQEILELSKGWAGWEAYATFYLWRSLEDGIL